MAKTDDFSDLPRDEDDLLNVYNDVVEQIDGAKGRDFQAYNQLTRLRLRLMARMEQIAEAGRATAADMPESELMARLDTYAARLPDAHLRIFADRYCARLHFTLTPSED